MVDRRRLAQGGVDELTVVAYAEELQPVPIDAVAGSVGYMRQLVRQVDRADLCALAAAQAH